MGCKNGENKTVLTKKASMILMGLWLIVTISSCVGQAQHGPAVTDPARAEKAEEDPLRRAYQAALADARYPTREKISQELIPISKDDPRLVWNDQGQVLVVTWSKKAYFKDFEPGKPYQLYGGDVTWVSLVPFMRRFCESYQGKDLRLRIAQNLGMPPNSANDSFVEMWANPRDIFRPCPDPEPWDMECLVRIPLIGQLPEQGVDKPPWYCGQDGPFSRQQSMAYLTVQQTHLDWMCENWIGSYTSSELYENYPWTALGYTYDWGSEDHVGQSEYIIPGNTWVTAGSITPTDTYCGR